MWHIVREILETVAALSSNGEGWPSAEPRPLKFWIGAVIGMTLFAVVVGSIWRFYLGAFLKP